MIKATTTRNRFRLYIDGLLHVSFAMADLVGVQSWLCDGYFIEYTLRGGVVKCEYKKRQTWEKILKQIDKVL